MEPVKNNRVFLKCSGGAIPSRHSLEEYFKARGEIADLFLPAKNNSVAYIEFADPVRFFIHYNLFHMILIKLEMFKKKKQSFSSKIFFNFYVPIDFLQILFTVPTFNFILNIV